MIIKVSVSTGLVNSEQSDELEIDDDDIEGLEGEELKKFIEEEAKAWLWNTIDFSYYVKE